MIILDHIIGLLVDVFANDMFFRKFNFRFYLSFYMYFALIAFLSLYYSTDQFLLFFKKGPTVSCFLCIFSSYVSTLISGCTTTFSFFFPSRIFLDSLNLLFRAFTISSTSLLAFYSLSLAYEEFMSGSSRLNEKNFLLLWFVFSLI